jgi:glycosyltransferase involved in cell wall biosynthesis
MLYLRARRTAVQGRIEEAVRLYEQLAHSVTEPRWKAILLNDRAVLTAQIGDAAAARQGFQEAVAMDPRCDPARANLSTLLDDRPESRVEAYPPPSGGEARAVRVAILSFLFNWPSTGGGITHTVELAQFLGRAGFRVQHFYARYEPWGIGQVEDPPPFPSQALPFTEAEWSLPAIQGRFRRAVDRFDADYVVITDSWNVKPRLAEALRGRRVILRLQAMECLCPLNNVRLLPEPGGRFRQCPLHQPASPAECAACVRGRGALSGGLHRAERALSGVGTPGYHECLLRALREAEAVLVVNPLTEALLRPYARGVRVVTAGMDPARFPWPWPEGPAAGAGKQVKAVLFAGLVGEWMKGFHVLHEACARLWQKRQDFELLATGDPPGRVGPFTRFVGWLSQAELPRQLRAADVVVVPAIAQEALGRTAVEAMAAGRPVVASRLGGLPTTVVEGITGLLFEPGDTDDLAHKLEMLLDDAALRQHLGIAGRRRFEEHYSWPVIIERHYRPLLQPVR